MSTIEWGGYGEVMGRLCMPNNIVLDTVMRCCYEYNRMLQWNILWVNGVYVREQQTAMENGCVAVRLYCVHICKHTR